MPRRGTEGFRRKFRGQCHANIREGRILLAHRPEAIFRKKADLCGNILLAAPKDVVKMGGDGPYGSAIFATKSTDAARTTTPGIAIRLWPNNRQDPIDAFTKTDEMRPAHHSIYTLARVVAKCDRESIGPFPLGARSKRLELSHLPAKRHF